MKVDHFKIVPVNVHRMNVMCFILPALVLIKLACKGT